MIKNTVVLKKDTIFYLLWQVIYFSVIALCFLPPDMDRLTESLILVVLPLSSNIPLAMLKWEKLPLRRKQQKALIVYKTLNELALDYLQCLFTQCHVNDYNLRNLEGKLSLPKLLIT